MTGIRIGCSFSVRFRRPDGVRSLVLPRLM
jgi:hypothetical protein